MSRVVRILAWLSLLTILIVTDGPISFRPQTPFSANVERFASLFVVGAFFGFVYHRRTLKVLVLLLLAICLFEILQLIIDTRHARFNDVIYKEIGSIAGLVSAKITRSLFST